MSYAKLGLEETKQKSSPTTRLHLEAVSLLAICYLREREIEKAKVLVIDAVRKNYNIKTFWRREQFYRRLIIRLEQESILVSLVNDEKRKLIVDEVEAETAKLVESKSQSEILLEMGNAVPRQSIEILSEIKEAYLRDVIEIYERDLSRGYELWELPYLHPPVDANDKHELGNRASSALKRVAWKALCSPDSEIYQAWNQGLGRVYDMRVIAAAIVAAFNSWSIGIPVLASSVAALAIKFGLDVFCETFAPESIMIDRRDNR